MVAQEEQASDLLVPDKSTHFIGQHCLDGGKAGRGDPHFTTFVKDFSSRSPPLVSNPTTQCPACLFTVKEHAHSINIIKRVDEGGTFIAFRNGHALP